MADPVTADRIRTWVDDELVEEIEQVPDEDAAFNLAIEMSNILLHVIRRRPDGPLLLGQEIEYGDDIRARIQGLSATERGELVSRIRETLTGLPVVYGFRNAAGENVPFAEMSHVLIEHRIYPDAIGQNELMRGLVDVWKAVRYLDDIVSLLDSVERTAG